MQSAGSVIVAGPVDPTSGMANSVMTPSGVMRPMAFVKSSVNHPLIVSPSTTLRVLRAANFVATSVVAPISFS